MTMTTSNPSSTSIPSPPVARPSDRDPWLATFVRRSAKVVIAVLLVAAGFWLGASVRPTYEATRSGAASHTTPGSGEQPVAAYWTCSMHPQVHQPGPGKCPLCGMDLIPAAAEADARPAKKVKYACSMFCVPPVDKPGKCPVCGMDMVPVEEEGQTGAETAADGAPPRITLSATALRLAQVRTAPVERRFVEKELRMIGKVEFDETRVKSITARVGGRLDRLFVDYTGVPVREGDHLVYLYSPELLAAQEELIQALRAFESSRSTPEADTGYQQSLEAARTKLRLWGLTTDQVADIERRGTPSDHLTIFAPMGGIVIEKHAVEGAYVETGTAIYTIADLSRVWMKMDAYESDLAWVRYGQDVTFETEAYPGEAFRGRIAFIDPVLNERTRTAKVRVNVDNADGRLKPEMFVRATVRSKVSAGGKVLDTALSGKWISPMHPEIVKDAPGTCDVCGMPLVPAESLGYASADTTSAAPPLAIPASAPLTTGRRAVVYVELPDQPGTYEGRTITLGPRAGDHFLVVDGLREGELVVARGNFQIDSAMQILARPSMMHPDEGDPGSDERRRRQAEPPGKFQVNAAFAAAFDAILKDYLALQEALSHDRFGPIGRISDTLRASLNTVQTDELSSDARQRWLSLAEAIGKSVTGLSEAKDIEHARASFDGVSDGLISALRTFELPISRKLAVFHCPMAFNDRGASWIQDQEEAENPYFGSAMFRCGVLREQIEPRRGVDANGGGRP